MSMKSTVHADPTVGGLTRQSEKDSCDVNLIVAMHARGGVSSHVVDRVAEFGFVPAQTFQEAMNECRRAQELFDELPAATRAFFQNDPGRFVSYVAKPEDKAKLVELGLVIPKAPEAKPPVGPSGTGAGGTPA